jgi:hypothetical protein
MTPEFEEALGLWESGGLSRDEVARRFPDEDIAGVLDAFDRMSAAAVGPTPNAGAAWEAVRAQLPVRPADRRRGRGKAIRLLAAAMIAVLTLGATAYAVVPSVRRALNDAAGVITGDPDFAPRPTPPADGTGSAADHPSPDTSGGGATTTDPDGGGTAENDSEADANEQSADADSNADSHSDVIEGDAGSGTDDGSVDGGSGSDGASVGDDSGSGEERASDAGDGDSATSGSDGSES